MSDALFNAVMVGFAAMMVWVAFYRPIHTGFFGSLGCVGLALSALFMIDNSLYASMESIESALLCFCASVGLIVLHAVLMVHRATRPEAVGTPHRRRSDWVGLDELAERGVGAAR